MGSSMRRFLVDERGATAVEYAVIAVMLSIAIVAGATAIGTKLSADPFGKINGNI